MTLSSRPHPYVVPSYSLTGDLLAYLSCGLQYRYQNRGSLPPSKPVQLWFGQFIHGVLEEAYRKWLQQNQSFPWTAADIDPIVDTIQQRLAARGISFQRFLLLGIAIERAYEAINQLGPILFPRISEAEVPIQGVRNVPPGTQSSRQNNYYQVVGVIDVLTSVRLQGLQVSNPIDNAVLQSVVDDTYEVIVDYKGMRRPGTNDPTEQSWEHHDWQVQTYAWLRQHQDGSSPVRSGMIFYLNELVPSTEDMNALHEEVFGNGPRRTESAPTGQDLEALRRWPRQRAVWRRAVDLWESAVRAWWTNDRATGAPFPRMPALAYPLSADYKRSRAIRQIPVTASSIQQSLARFDSLVGEIEGSISTELSGTPVPNSWIARPRHATCTVCDFRKFCPAPANTFRGIPLAP